MHDLLEEIRPSMFLKCSLSTRILQRALFCRNWKKWKIKATVQHCWWRVLRAEAWSKHWPRQFFSAHVPIIMLLMHHMSCCLLSFLEGSFRVDIDAGSIMSIIVASLKTSSPVAAAAATWIATVASNIVFAGPVVADALTVVAATRALPSPDPYPETNSAGTCQSWTSTNGLYFPMGNGALETRSRMRRWWIARSRHRRRKQRKRNTAEHFVGMWVNGADFCGRLFSSQSF